MTHQIVTSNGRRFVMVPVAEWRRAERLLATPKTATRSNVKLPPLPKPDADGHVPALSFLQNSIARDIIRERAELGLTQADLAEKAGLRKETLCRLESGKHSPTVRTVEKIERALEAARKKLARKTRK